MDVKHNRKAFYKHFHNKSRAKEKLHPLLLGGANIGTKDEKKSEVLNAFCASAFNSKSSCWSTRPPELENRDGEQKEILIIQGEMLSGLLHHLETQNGWDPFKDTGATGGSAQWLYSMVVKVSSILNEFMIQSTKLFTLLFRVKTTFYCIFQQ